LKGKNFDMDIKSLFRQRSESISELQQKYKSIQREKESLEEKADRLRAKSLKSDIPDVQSDLETIQGEISLADTALKEIKADMESMIEKRIQSDFEGLNEQKLEFETKLNDLSTEAGKQTAKAVQSLQVLNLSFANLLSKLIRETIIDYTTDWRFKNQMPIFLAAYSQAINADFEHVDFRSWKNEIIRIEQLQPGSLESERHVAAKVKKLISA
jgi:hypothetical protein